MAVDQLHGRLAYRSILALAVPIMLSNASTPLVGVVDTAIVGRIGDPAYIGGAAIGAIIFNFVFWGFGFLRMGTTGLTAQALGADDAQEVAATLGRALLVALAVGVALIALQWPIREVASSVMGAGPRVSGLARGYFDIRIWAAPAALANYALLGWFIGLGRTDIGLMLQLLLNLTNMALDALFVFGFGADVRGVALGTLMAEMLAAVAGLIIALRYLRARHVYLSMAKLLDRARLRRTFAVNRDIMIRTLALIIAFLWFASQGARQGDIILAANSILLQFIAMAAFFLDGLAFATEALVGQAIGAAHRAGLAAAVWMTTTLAAGTAAVLSLGLLVLGPWIIDFLTADALARATARMYLPWAAGAPLLGVWAFQLDGIFIGAARTADMRNAMLMSLAIFFVAWWILRPWGDHGLWAAFYVHYVARAATLLVCYPRLLRAV